MKQMALFLPTQSFVVAVRAGCLLARGTERFRGVEDAFDDLREFLYELVAIGRDVLHGHAVFLRPHVQDAAEGAEPSAAVHVAESRLYGATLLLLDGQGIEEGLEVVARGSLAVLHDAVNVTHG